MLVRIIKMLSPGTQCKIRFIAIALGASLVSTGGAWNSNHNCDFEGNGCMSPTVYNENTGEWRILTDRNNYNPGVFIWGGLGCRPVQR